MKRTLSFAMAGAALSVSAPAYAALEPTNPSFPCANGQVAPTADACVGWFKGNLDGVNGGSLADTLLALQLLDPSITSVGTPLKLDFVSTNVIDFGKVLSGKTIIGIHKGGAGDFNGSGSAFFLWNNLAPASSITLNLGGLSNSTLYATVMSVPEPATWFLMIAGIGMIGFGLRRQRQQVRAKIRFA